MILIVLVLQEYSLRNAKCWAPCCREVVLTKVEEAGNTEALFSHNTMIA